MLYINNTFVNSIDVYLTVIMIYNNVQNFLGKIISYFYPTTAICVLCLTSKIYEPFSMINEMSNIFERTWFVL